MALTKPLALSQSTLRQRSKERMKAGIRTTVFVGAAVLAIALAGCSSNDKAAKLLNPDPPDKMFAAGDSLLSRGRFEDAAIKFEDLDRDHPYSPEARRAIVMAAFAYYKAKKFPEAISTAKRYLSYWNGWPMPMRKNGPKRQSGYSALRRTRSRSSPVFLRHSAACSCA